MSPLPREVVVATSNPGKLREFREILAGRPVRLLSLADIAPVGLPEESDDYTANAVAKARTVARASGRAALADDSGLEVEALGGAPGPRSARYGGPGLDAAGRVAHLLEALRGVPSDARCARFVCVAALASPDGGMASAFGETRGRILRCPSGSGGFGYDPVFALEGDPRSVAELSPPEKHASSHRARALAALAACLAQLA
jgi:XTP/dITP diphosphohydrolase